MYQIITSDHYDYYLNIKFRANYNAIKYQETLPNKGTLGKYLFFNKDREELIREVTTIAKRFHLSTFRVSKVSTDRGMYSFVASIFDDKDNYSLTLKNYINDESVNSYYRHWKLQNKSDKGMYSSQYLQPKTTEL